MVVVPLASGLRATATAPVAVAAADGRLFGRIMVGSTIRLIVLAYGAASPATKTVAVGRAGVAASAVGSSNKLALSPD
jgi:hypothetical protein